MFCELSPTRSVSSFFSRFFLIPVASMFVMRFVELLGAVGAIEFMALAGNA